ncbi:MAG TPA: nucleoside deaminase [Gemmatimonadaceae bacterium]|nr:nucleoside deaminase [Gemmatimonadaceae bacterium]
MLPSPPLSITVSLPAWTAEVVPWERHFPTDEDRMRLTIALARENVLRETGGPFGAAVFAMDTGALVAVGVNGVVRQRNAALHGEMMAYMLAQHRVGSYTLDAPGLPPHELVTSCEPCAMCLGATLWSGVRRVVIGARREDALAIGFDEGPVFSESYAYLEQRGVAIRRDVLRDEARAVLELYRHREGAIYNG